jgi:protein TonB
VKVATFTLPQGDVVGPGRAGVVTGGELDRTPRTRLQPAPLYPAEARRDGRSGSVTVEFVVDESGVVVAPRVTSSSDRVFEEAALRAVAKWRFEPGRRHGKVVRFRLAVPIHFSLNE